MSSAKRQQGAVMLVALIMLLLLTLLAVTSMRETTVQNRLAGNVSEQRRAYNAAESALREAERRLTALRGTAAFVNASSGYDSCTDSVNALSATKGNLCILSQSQDLNTQAKVQAWAKAALATVSINPAATSVGYTGYDDKARFTLPPRWVITAISGASDPNLDSSYRGSGTYYYRVTAVARSGGGRFPVILQSIVKLEDQ